MIGAGAESFVTGGGSSEIEPYSYVSPAEAIRERAGPGVAVSADDGSDAARAAALAGRSEIAVVVVSSYSTEGIDRRCLTLECPPAWGDQDGLIEAVAAANPRTVVVVQSGGPVLTPWRGEVGALLAAWYPGSSGGRRSRASSSATSTPGGRLPLSFPASEADTATANDRRAYPGVDDAVVYDEGLFVGYRHYLANGTRPAYGFGEGLSYTRFRFSGLRVRRASGASATVSLRVANTGRRDGVAVPQLYLGLPGRRGVPQPPKALKGFRRVELREGQARRVRFRLERRDLSFWSVERDRWRLARGCARVLAGPSSERTPLRGRLGVGGPCR